MTHLAVIGPNLLSYQAGASQYDLSDFVFEHPNIFPFVGKIYFNTIKSARRLRIEVSFPIAEPRLRPRAAWVNAVQRIASADAVFAVFIGEGQAIPIEANLARLMGLPLVVSAIDTQFTGQFEKAGVPIIDPYLVPDAAEQAIQMLFGEGEGSAGIGMGSDATV